MAKTYKVTSRKPGVPQTGRSGAVSGRFQHKIGEGKSFSVGPDEIPQKPSLDAGADERYENLRAEGDATRKVNTKALSLDEAERGTF